MGGPLLKPWPWSVEEEGCSQEWGPCLCLLMEGQVRHERSEAGQLWVMGTCGDSLLIAFIVSDMENRP